MQQEYLLKLIPVFLLPSWPLPGMHARIISYLAKVPVWRQIGKEIWRHAEDTDEKIGQSQIS